MSLEAAVELLAHARRHRYAVGYFESWDMASLEGVIDAAEQSRARSSWALTANSSPASGVRCRPGSNGMGPWAVPRRSRLAFPAP